MNQSIENRYKVMDFCYLIENLGIYGKKLIESATKGRGPAKTASKRVVQKTAEATGDLIGNKIADQITSVGKSKNKEKEKKS